MYLQDMGHQYDKGTGESLLDVILKRNLDFNLNDNTNLRFQFPIGWDKKELTQNPYGVHLTYDF